MLSFDLTRQQVDRSGKMGYDEFKTLLNQLCLWKVRTEWPIFLRGYD